MHAQAESSEVQEVQEVRDTWKRRGFSCHLGETPPGAEWRNYIHDGDELIMPLRGKIEVELPGQKVQLKPGEECLIPRGFIHTVRSAGKQPPTWVYGFASEYAYTD